MTKINNEQINTCPFLGLNGDDTSHMAFTSPENFCHHCKPIVQIRLEHQNDYCLDINFTNCPVYTGEPDRRMPSNLVYIDEAGNRPITFDKRLLWAGLVFAVITVTVSLLFIFQNSGRLGSSTPIPMSINSIQTLTAIANNPFTEITATPNAMVLPDPTVSANTALPAVSPTVSPFPTLTVPVPTSNSTETRTAIIVTSSPPSPTSTQASTHSLDIPIGQDQLFVIHKVSNGENLSTLADKYKTSLEAILAVNYMLSIPIRIDAVVVIPLQNKDPQGMPVFEPYQVKQNQINAEALAKELETDPILFKHINTLEDGETLHQGDWFLVPRQQRQ